MAVAPLAAGQVTFFAGYVYTLFLTVISEFLFRARAKATLERSAKGSSNELSTEESPLLRALSGSKLEISSGAGSAAAGAAAGAGAAAPVANGDGATATAADVERGSGGGGGGSRSPPGLLADMSGSGLVKCLLLDLDELVKQRQVLWAAVEFGTLMCWYFIADRTNALPEEEKSYSRDLFLFLFVVLTSVAIGASNTVLKAPVLLNRGQTEEWKGWMQVLFLLYHYFEAKEAYNAIRVFIAAYVWMTGFGNFSYYYKTGDFSIGRFAQMMWRLNFLVFLTCVVMQDSYMLYYICPMHTIYTVLVYATLGLAPQLNKSNAGIVAKLVGSFVFVLVCWDLKPIFYALWSPFTWLVGYTDPRKPSGDVLYEWFFRSSLDRFIWIYGMICAYLHPHSVALFNSIDSLQPVRRQLTRVALVSVCGVAFYFWYVHVYCLPKVEYNAIHPYTSWIPITIWMIVRNLTPTLRLHHLRLYGWLGCITLETYISQFHIWLRSSVSNGQPKMLLALLPGYPLLNFAAVSAGYVFVSYRLFELTNTLKNAAVPHSNNALLGRNILLMGAVGAGAYFLVAAFMALTAGVRG